MGIEKLSALISVCVHVNVINLHLRICRTPPSVGQIKSGKAEVMMGAGGRKVWGRQFVIYNVAKISSHL